MKIWKKTYNFVQYYAIKKYCRLINKIFFKKKKQNYLL